MARLVKARLGSFSNQTELEFCARLLNEPSSIVKSSVHLKRLVNKISQARLVKGSNFGLVKGSNTTKLGSARLHPYLLTFDKDFNQCKEKETKNISYHQEQTNNMNKPGIRRSRKFKTNPCNKSRTPFSTSMKQMLNTHQKPRA